MPRPGPRPYECVRRVWHSDRHQPIRGSLIQEIFRIVNEIHSSATKKNKEWQEKLPLVVLKAEEIMYSKANSLAEYMDLKTLPERANDAIDTIIRRDEATESGELLPPCIEAALNLGCIPRRASRSQRHNSPSCYLSSPTQVTESSAAPNIADNMALNGSPHSLPPHSSNTIPNSSQFVPYRSTLLTATTVNATRLTSGSGFPVLQDKPMPHETMGLLPMSCSDISLSAENVSVSWKDKSSPLKETHPLSSLGRMSPMYYSANSMETVSPFQYPQVSNCDAFIVDTPHVSPVVEAETGFLHNLLGCGNSLDVLNGTTRASSNFGISSENPAGMEYDLSLRLGSFSTPCISRENRCIVEDVGSSSCDGSRFCDISLSKIRTSQFGCSSSSTRRGKGYSFFSLDTVDEPLESCSSK